MIEPNSFIDMLINNNIDFFTGVPDSHLSNFSNALIKRFKLKEHIIAINEGNATALAAGYYLSTGHYPCVYLQNSGLGNIINPVASLLNEEVYGIPCVFIIGWRGEPDIKDEPQHIFQGKITLRLLKDLNIKTFILDKYTSIADINKILKKHVSLLESRKQIAFLVKKDVFEKCNIGFSNNFLLIRERAIELILENSGEDIIISTTGKISRELFEIRERNNSAHNRDFLTVGSMGHSSTIALSIALNKTQKTVWSIDGDGSILMHTGAMALIGNKKPDNFIHVVLNNASHESVGGAPTICGDFYLYKLAKVFGYKKSFLANNEEELKYILKNIRKYNFPVFIEVRVSIYSRENLGRPTISTIENRDNFIEFLKG